jgi:hypothetical protein
MAQNRGIQQWYSSLLQLRLSLQVRHQGLRHMASPGFTLYPPAFEQYIFISAAVTILPAGIAAFPAAPPCIIAKFIYLHSQNLQHGNPHFYYRRHF